MLGVNFTEYYTAILSVRLLKNKLKQKSNLIPLYFSFKISYPEEKWFGCKCGKSSVTVQRVYSRTVSHTFTIQFPVAGNKILPSLS